MEMFLMCSMYFDFVFRYLEICGKFVYFYVVNKDVVVDEVYRLKLFRVKFMSVIE